MKIHHLEFSKLGTGLSGGEKCMIELIQFLIAKRIPNVLYTTDNGKATYERLGLKECEFLNYKTIESYADELKYGLLVSFIIRTFKAASYVKNIRFDQEDIVICHSEFYPNSVPLNILSRNNPRSKKFSFIHMLAPSIWRGYEGQYTGKFQFPRPRIIHYSLIQWLHKILAPDQGGIITVAESYRKSLQLKYPRNRINVLEHFGGDDVVPNMRPKEYDLLWIGRFHQQKGLLDAIKILNIIKQSHNNVKLLVVGGGNAKIKKDFLKEVEEKKLNQNVTYVGEIIDPEEKFVMINKAKILVMSSTYESFGLVNLEAMKCGVPVVAFDLPVYAVFKKGMKKVPILDHQKMADEIMALLNDETALRKLSKDAEEFGKAFSWTRTGEEVLSIIRAES